MRLQSNQPIQVVIADRSARARDGLLAILKTQPDIEVVGKTDQVAELFVLVAATQPRVVFLDAHLAGLDVIETTRLLKEHWPKIKIVVTSLYTDRQAEVLAAGADAFLIKGCPVEDQIEIILGKLI
jgi:DNA-binding NarL/FixJ family response regulator